MKVSIIVPAFNEEKLLAATLRSIQAAAAAFAAGGCETELIVCDNNSSDRTAELAGAAGAQVVFEPVNQIARARNTGAAAARGDWLVFVDADSQPSHELFAEVAGQIKSGRILAGGCTVQMETRHFWGRLFLRGWNWLSRARRLMAGSFIFCDAAAFRQVGGFNQELYVSEEIDLSWRLQKLARQQGKKIVILHRHPLASSARKLELYSRGDYLRLLARLVLSRGKAMRERASCQLWYDGRR